MTLSVFELRGKSQNLTVKQPVQFQERNDKPSCKTTASVNKPKCATMTRVRVTLINNNNKC